MYQVDVAGKPRTDGALAALKAMGVPDAERKAPTYAARKQMRLEELIQDGSVVAFPDALRFVEAIICLGWPMAVASSSKNANAMLRLIRLADGRSLIDAFGANICGRDLQHGKPDPEIFLSPHPSSGWRPPAASWQRTRPRASTLRPGNMASLGVARLNDAAFLRAEHADLVVTSLDDVAIDGLAKGRLYRRAA